MKYKQLIAQITKRQTAIGRERDQLDNLIGELETLRSDCQDAYESLQDARDALSRLV